MGPFFSFFGNKILKFLILVNRCLPRSTPSSAASATGRRTTSGEQKVQNLFPAELCVYQGLTNVLLPLGEGRDEGCPWHYQRGVFEAGFAQAHGLGNASRWVV